jgi:hypothetical protein
LNRDTRLRHDVVATLQGLVGARLDCVRVTGPSSEDQEPVAALRARPFHCCSRVELELVNDACIVLACEADHEHESWEPAEGWESGYAIVARKKKRTDGAQTIDASDLPPWQSHIGRAIDRIQILGERSRGPTVVRLEFVDGAVWIGCGEGDTSGDSFAFRFGDGRELLVAPERQARSLSARAVGMVLWDSRAG